MQFTTSIILSLFLLASSAAASGTMDEDCNTVVEWAGAEPASSDAAMILTRVATPVPASRTSFSNSTTAAASYSNGTKTTSSSSKTASLAGTGPTAATTAAATTAADATEATDGSASSAALPTTSGAGQTRIGAAALALAVIAMAA